VDIFVYFKKKNDMPSSKKRQHHHKQQQVNHPMPPGGSKANERIVTAAVILFAVIGLGIAFFASGGAITWIVAGTVIGGIAGYFFGKAIKKGLLKG
jgi:hypothetical protein